MNAGTQVRRHVLIMESQVPKSHQYLVSVAKESENKLKGVCLEWHEVGSSGNFRASQNVKVF
jgi:hypothetical protein